MIGSVCEDAMGLSRLYSSEVYRYWACIIMYVQRASVFFTLAIPVKYRNMRYNKKDSLNTVFHSLQPYNGNNNSRLPHLHASKYTLMSCHPCFNPRQLFCGRERRPPEQKTARREKKKILL